MGAAFSLSLLREFPLEANLDPGFEMADETQVPRLMEEALDRFEACEPVRKLLGEDFFQTYLRVKSVELDLFQSVVTSWERDHLLLKV